MTLPDATSQQKSLKDRLVGAWIYDSSTVTRSSDGTKTERRDINGMLIYTGEGYFMFMTMAKDTPRIASNDRARATSQEALAVLKGTRAYYGTYTVDETEATIIPKVEGSTFVNLIDSAHQRRIVTAISDNEMRFMNPQTPSGETLEFVWKRAR